MIDAISCWVTGRGVTGRRNLRPRTSSSCGRIDAIAGGREADEDDGAGSGEGGTGRHSGSARGGDVGVGAGTGAADVGAGGGGLGAPATTGATCPVTHEQR